MHGGGLETYHRTSGIIYELPQYLLAVVLLAVSQARERADADDVAETPDHGDGLTQVLRLVAVHDDAHLGLEFPAVAVDVQHDGVHAEVQGGLLAAQAGAQRIVEEHQDDGLVLAQMVPGKRIPLDLEGLLEGVIEVSYILYVEE